MSRTNPYLIDGPAVISFSGGRTSAYMLRRCLDAGLAHDVHVVFSNTGKEREETLDFVQECSRQWDVPITWLEYHHDGKAGFRQVTYETASRNGEPFARLIEVRKYLPNVVTRFCTQELKIRVMRDWMRSHGYEEWSNVVGIRADEPKRVARLKGTREWDVLSPLATAGVTIEDVTTFWAAQTFDLRLRPDEGNCDLCFMKGMGKRIALIRDRPESAGWWIDQERRIGSTFRANRPDYTEIRRRALLPVIQAPQIDDQTISCFCGD